MSTGIVGAPLPKAGGNFVTMGICTAFFAGMVGSFYYSRSFAHEKDDQTWIVRHGQQPGNAFRATGGARLVMTHAFAPSDSLSAHLPLPGNDDNRGSEGIVGTLMSLVANRGLHPDGRVPEHPKNIQVQSYHAL